MSVAKRTAEVIDLTADDDDDGGQRATQSYARPILTNGHGNTSLTNAPSVGTPNGHGHPRPLVAHDAEPPAKRPKLGQVVPRVASDAVKPFARAAASQAHRDQPQCNEAIMRQKIHDVLCQKFGQQIERIERTGGVVSHELELRQQIIAVARDCVQAFSPLPECRTPRAPFLPSASPLVPQPAGPVARDYVPLTLENAPPNTTTHVPLARTNASSQTPSRVQPPSSNAWPTVQPRLNSTPSRNTYEVVDLTHDATNKQGGQPEEAQVPKAPISHFRTDPERHVPNRAASGLPVLRPGVAMPSILPSPSRASPSPSPIPAAPQVQNGEVSTPRMLRRRRNVPSTPSSSKRRLHDNVATSPANYHVRASRAALALEPGTGDLDTQNQNTSTYFTLAHRPYLGIPALGAVLRGNGRLGKITSTMLQRPEVFHVDFTPDEVRKVQLAVRAMLSRPAKGFVEPYHDLQKLLRRHSGKYPEAGFSGLARKISLQILGRNEDDLRALLDDVFNKRVESGAPQQILSLGKDPYDKHRAELRESRLSSFLMAREISGGRGSTRRSHNLPNEFRKHFDLELRSEFTNCAGDISTISWVSNDAYLAGTTVHMDSHNQQYNKPGNLVLGSVSRGSAALMAYDDHRIMRPIVEKGQNSTEEMRESQDPWLYTSVVSSDHDSIHNRTYTSGFDKKVKIWTVKKTHNPDNPYKMRCIGTWEHHGPVNFVQASSFADDDYGLVATAADVPTEAVRIYKVPTEDSRIAQSSFTPFSCSTKRNLDGTPLVTEKWTYFPSTMRWGIEASVKHYLLVGYSPRSLTNDDNDISTERLNTGELCLWDATSGNLVNITGAKTQNVFEVMWHPSLPVFIAATSPNGEGAKHSTVRTQVRIFKRIDSHDYFGGTAFGQIKALDCAADDINELTIMPNSATFFYVAAGCTDGKAYVWDSALSDKPIQVLSHGPAFQGVAAGDDEDDTGVKFISWGTSLDRFYTGSSDGVVKEWNVRTSGGKKAKGRVVLEAPSQISFGAFSPDRSRLIIGDASGRVFILSVDEDDGKPSEFDKFLEKQGIKKRKPNPVTPHRPPPPPPGPKSLTNQQLGHAYVTTQQLRYSGDPTVGMVQDVNYAETNLFRPEAHIDYDPTQEILGHVSPSQQENTKKFADSMLPARISRLRQVEYTKVDSEHGRLTILKEHDDNTKLDLHFEDLSLEIRDVLAGDGIGQRELLEGPEYPGLEEQDDVELRKGRVEIVRDEEDHETRFWV